MHIIKKVIQFPSYLFLLFLFVPPLLFRVLTLFSTFDSTFPSLYDIISWDGVTPDRLLVPIFWDPIYVDLMLIWYVVALLVAGWCRFGFTWGWGWEWWADCWLVTWLWCCWLISGWVVGFSLDVDFGLLGRVGTHNLSDYISFGKFLLAVWFFSGCLFRLAFEWEIEWFWFWLWFWFWCWFWFFTYVWDAAWYTWSVVINPP